ncbi:MAG: hypothetical protein EHM58_02525 [Ignavibacteriae bacterium]|nr:MAG: hypothetical protein EHM58_02525 [Ignavibacteriota bacterium]
MNRSLVSIFRILGRACWYAITTGSVLLTGYILGLKGKPLTFEAILLGVPFFFSIGFFMVYSICFHYSDKELMADENQLRLTQNESIFMVFFFLSIPFSVILSLIYLIVTGNWPSVGILLASGLYAILFCVYGFFLLNQFRKDKKTLSDNPQAKKNLTIRHRIIWPTIFTVGFSLYYGMFFENFNKGDTYPYYPIIILIFYIIGSERIKNPKFFLTVSMFATFLAIFVPIILSSLKLYPEIAEVGFSVFSCIAISGYLAVFESWRMTSFERNMGRHTTNYDSKENKKITAPLYELWEVYYFSTLGILTFFICILPFTYIFTDYELLFFILFSAHAIAALIIWCILGQSPSINHICFIKTKTMQLQTCWIIIKVLMGSIFLVILFLLTFLNTSTSSVEFIPIIIYPVILGIFLFLLYRYIVSPAGTEFKYSHNNFDSRNWLWLWVFLTNQLNYLRLAAILSYFLIIPVLYLKAKNPSLAYKADCAFLFYIIIIILAFGFETLFYCKKKSIMNNTLKKLLGIGHTTRITTSTVISLIVLFPNLGNSNELFNHLFLAINLLFTSMGGFALNDYFDMEKDIINKPHRPIPSGKITRRTTLIVAIILLFLSSVFSLYNTITAPQGYMQIVFLIAMIVYNYFTKHLATYKTVYTALVSALVVAHTIFINYFDKIFILLPFASFFFILGREIFMDILDMKGDKKSGIFTLPIRFGVKKSSIAGFLFLIIGTILIFPLFLKEKDLIRGGIIITSIILFSVFWYYGTTTQKKIAIIYLWVPMIIGLTTLFL